MQKRHYLLAIALLIVAATSLSARRSDLQRKGPVAILAPNAPGATGSDVLRGLTRALPVGPGGDDETCLGSDLLDTVILDRATPATSDAYWYLVRGVNACGHGPYGSEAVPRVSATCP